MAQPTRHLSRRCALVIATMTLALAAGASLVDAARLANRAAGIVVGKFGPATVSVSDLSGSESPRQAM